MTSAAHDDPGTTRAAHVAPVRSYVTTFATLLGLTAVTVSVAFLDLGALNTVAALAIATGKAALVLVFFMHLTHGSRLTWLAVGAALAWLVLLIVLTLADARAREHELLPEDRLLQSPAPGTRGP